MYQALSTFLLSLSFFLTYSLETDLIDIQGEVIFYLITFIFSKLLEMLEAVSFLIKPIFVILQC